MFDIFYEAQQRICSLSVPVSLVAEVATARGRKIVIHNCLTKADLRSLFISHMGFQFAQAEV